MFDAIRVTLLAEPYIPLGLPVDAITDDHLFSAASFQGSSLLGITCAHVYELPKKDNRNFMSRVLYSNTVIFPLTEIGIRSKIIRFH